MQENDTEQSKRMVVSIPQLISQNDLDDLKQQDEVIEKMIEKQRKSNLLLRENFKDYSGSKRQALESNRLSIPNKVIPNPQNKQKITEFNNKIIENQKIFKQVLEKKTHDVPEPGQKPTNAQKQAILQKQLEIKHKVEQAFNIQKTPKIAGKQRKTFTYREREQKMEQLRQAMRDKEIVDQNIAYDRLLGRQQLLYNEYIEQLKPQLFSTANSHQQAKDIVQGFQELREMQDNQIQIERMKMTSLYEQQLQKLEDEKQAKMEQFEQSFDISIAINLIDDFGRLLGGIDQLLDANTDLKGLVAKTKTKASVQRNIFKQLQSEIQILEYQLGEVKSKVETQIDENGTFLDAHDAVGTARLQREIIQATLQNSTKKSPMSQQLKIQHSLRSLFDESSQKMSNSSKDRSQLSQFASQSSFKNLQLQSSFNQSQRFDSKKKQLQNKSEQKKQMSCQGLPRQKLSFTKILQDLEISECSSESISQFKLTNEPLQLNNDSDSVGKENKQANNKNGSTVRFRIELEDENCGSSNGNASGQNHLLSPPYRQSSQYRSSRTIPHCEQSAKHNAAESKTLQKSKNQFHDIKQGNTASLLLTKYQLEDQIHQEQLQKNLREHFKSKYQYEQEQNANLSKQEPCTSADSFINYTNELKAAIVDALQEEELDKIQAAQAKIINFPTHLLTFIEQLETNLERERIFRQQLGEAGQIRVLKAETGLRLLRQVRQALQAERQLLMTRDVETLKRLATLGQDGNNLGEDDYDAAFEHKVALERAKAKREKENPTLSQSKSLTKLQKQKFSSMVDLLQMQQQTRIFDQVDTLAAGYNNDKETDEKVWLAKRAQITSELKRSRMCLETDV